RRSIGPIPSENILCTARQQDRDIFHLLVDLLRSQQPKLLDILPPVVLSANDLDGGTSNHTNVGSVNAHQKSSGHDQRIPFPACRFPQGNTRAELVLREPKRACRPRALSSRESGNRSARRQ